MLWVLAVACAPPPEPPALPDVILLTAERSPAAEAADRLGTGELVRGVPSSVALRPALATLLTGRLPSHHGVRDPVLHAPVVPTMAEILADRGWSTRSEPGGILHAGERWGFGADGAGPVLVWLHGDDRLDVALAAHDPDSHLVVVGLDGEDDLLWCGPDVADLPATVGHVDVLPTLLAALGVPAALDGRDVRGAESGTLDTEDARGLAFGLGIEANGRARANEAPVLEAAVSPSLFVFMERRAAIATDLASRGLSRSPAEAVGLVAEVAVLLAA
ncbi:MAG: hypothetical protein KC656_10325, partial [Myxococcales bacterium]|nr:hypothetical protein [Myxococcales bacterium]